MKQMTYRFQSILIGMVRLLLVLLGVSALVFLMSQFVSGDIAETIVINRGLEPTVEEVNRVREELGLDLPITIQYARWISDVVSGDFGVSYRSNRPVLEELLIRWPATLILAICTMALTVSITLILGLLSAYRPRGWINTLSSIISIIGSSVPSFVIGLGLIYVFAIKLKWVNVTSQGNIMDLILPVLTLTMATLPANLRLFRATTLEVLKETFVTVLHSRGYSVRKILWGDVLKVSVGPWLTQFGVSIGHLLGGTVVVESIFGYPGVGQYIVTSILNRDYPVIQIYVLFMGVIFVMINVLIDVLVHKFQPYQSLSKRRIV